MKISGNKNCAALLVAGFFVIVLSVAFANDSYYPVRIIAGENSVGTWLSGAMLIAAAVLSLVTGLKKEWFPWYLFAVFFAVLALDERFMFHEHFKERLIFTYPALPNTWHFLYEIPVITGALIGMVVTVMLWRRFTKVNRFFLSSAAICGIASVTMDVFSLGVIWEDSLKIVGELFVVIALLKE